MAPAKRRDDARGRLDDPAPEAGLGQHAGPCIEELDDLDAGGDLRRQILDRRVDQAIDQPGEAVGIAIGPELDIVKVRLVPPSTM